LPEVQGDVYLAWRCIADLFERDGELKTAEQLRQNARRLYERFNEHFWIPEAHYYAFCRQADGRFSKSIASNPAHALWTGIIDPKHAPEVARRVLEADMFSGWGVRTLSATDRTFNPVEYQLGSVWPHDNALIVAGMQRYGCVGEAERVFTAVTEAASQFTDFRLPELFAGYDRRIATRPVKYPVACNPQAWSAGSIPYMLACVLGLIPDAFNHHLQIVRPHLPEWLQRVELRHLQVGESEVDLDYYRANDKTVVAVKRKDPDLRVSIEP
jgi:glycogen debranching enzyme